MHLCLQIAEILTMIFASYDGDKESIQALYSLALVCKIFHEPARDALWRFQRSFITLVKMFPEDLWDEIEDPAIALIRAVFDLPEELATSQNETYVLPPSSVWEKPTTVTFKRPLTPSDWARFQLYARLMEKLSFDKSSNSLSVFGARELDPSVFRAIQSSLDLGHFDRPLLQNLTEFTFNQVCDEVSLRDACVFLGPQLKTLRLTIPSSLEGLRTFTTALKAGCPAIKHLYISSYQPSRSNRVNRVVSDLVCSLSCLRTVSCNQITCDAQALKHLSSLPSLQRLDVHLPNELAQESLRDAFPNILPFLAMRRLDITVALTASAVEFLRVASNSSDLESLGITIDRIVPTSEQLHAVLTVMQQSSFCNTLTTFKFQDHVEMAEDATPLHNLDAQTLSPLLECPNLENITIGISYGHATIDNSLLKEMASAWPCLRCISIYSRHDARRWHCKADLRGLTYLAQNCHSLQSVSLQFDVSLPLTMMIAMHPDKIIHYESLTNLDVSRSHVSDPLAVATFLADVFPNLTIHHGYYIRPTPAAHSIWGDFEDELSEDERSTEYIEMAERWRDVVQIFNARQANRNVRMQSVIYN